MPYRGRYSINAEATTLVIHRVTGRQEFHSSLLMLHNFGRFCRCPSVLNAYGFFPSPYNPVSSNLVETQEAICESSIMHDFALFVRTPLKVPGNPPVRSTINSQQSLVRRAWSASQFALCGAAAYVSCRLPSSKFSILSALCPSAVVR